MKQNSFKQQRNISSLKKQEKLIQELSKYKITNLDSSDSNFQYSSKKDFSKRKKLRRNNYTLNNRVYNQKRYNQSQMEYEFGLENSYRNQSVLDQENESKFLNKISDLENKIKYLKDFNQGNYNNCLKEQNCCMSQCKDLKFLKKTVRCIVDKVESLEKSRQILVQQNQKKESELKQLQNQLSILQEQFSQLKFKSDKQEKIIQQNQDVNFEFLEQLEPLLQQIKQQQQKKIENKNKQNLGKRKTKPKFRYSTQQFARNAVKVPLRKLRVTTKDKQQDTLESQSFTKSKQENLPFLKIFNKDQNKNQFFQCTSFSKILNQSKKQDNKSPENLSSDSGLLNL